MTNKRLKIVVDPDVHLLTNPDIDDFQSETTSIGSAVYRGVIENGRRYQTLRENQYWAPADEQQFESLEAGHAVAGVMDGERPNPLFQAPISKSAKNILDIGTGNGLWAIDVADILPEATIRGVDLFPPPVSWVPPKCILEVDDVLRAWTWSEQFDFIHMRFMLGSFNEGEWDKLYKKCYNNLQPGGWIEQLEFDAHIESDDNTLPKDSMAATWGETILGCAERATRKMDTINTMRDSIEKAGFVDIRERAYKWPIGPWPRDKNIKEAGLLNYQMWSLGIEGWGMWLLTRFGEPKPWSREEVIAYVAKIRGELKSTDVHSYQRARRVWARKPDNDPGQK
ncbi:hypothetical protein N7478_009346 [Penicillium angulare]|uniref:uncharacterized protein n=1 Tax=Penicillium angulare TaxID=116970 RepID=UPI00253F6D83|nr:uncharacterized protein N7478_009346 [Penicillium angulare]KAJ5266538.1 hypothetical protein N7478_009346 [Penicillium angulare]